MSQAITYHWLAQIIFFDLGMCSCSCGAGEEAAVTLCDWGLSLPFSEDRE